MPGMKKSYSRGGGRGEGNRGNGSSGENAGRMHQLVEGEGE